MFEGVDVKGLELTGEGVFASLKEIMESSHASCSA